METFDIPTREYIWQKYNNKCANKHDKKCLINEGLSIHHIVHNTKTNRRLYGKKIQSKDNGILLCHRCHTNYGSIPEIKEKKIELTNLWNSKET